MKKVRIQDITTYIIMFTFLHSTYLILPSTSHKFGVAITTNHGRLCFSATCKISKRIFSRNTSLFLNHMQTQKQHSHHYHENHHENQSILKSPRSSSMMMFTHHYTRKSCNIYRYHNQNPHHHQLHYTTLPQTIWGDTRNKQSCRYISKYSKLRKQLMEEEEIVYTRNSTKRRQQNDSYNENETQNDDQIDMSSSSLSSIKQNQISEQIISILAHKANTWKRLSDVVHLSSLSTETTTTSTRTTSTSSIADIGTDHGFLSIALAISGRYNQVIGIDVSQNALNNAIIFEKKVLDILTYDDNHNQHTDDSNISISSRNDDNHDNNHLPLEYRLGNGLYPLQPGEGDSICLVGMGVDSMLSILAAPHGDKNTVHHTNDDNHNQNHYHNHRYYLDYINSQTLYLQSPKNRPKHLVKLYQTLYQDLRFVPVNERIVYVKNRWYITSVFKQRHHSELEEDQDCIGNNDDSLRNFINDEDCDDKTMATAASSTTSSSSTSTSSFRLPGYFLSNHDCHNQREEYDKYVKYHLRWLENDLNKKGYLSDEENVWRDANLI